MIPAGGEADGPLLSPVPSRVPVTSAARLGAAGSAPDASAICSRERSTPIENDRLIGVWPVRIAKREDGHAPENPDPNRTAGTYDAFVSYSRRDMDASLELVSDLEAAGKEVWIDLEDIPAGSQWDEELSRGIEASGAFVFIISPDSLVSTHCRRELAHALALGKRVLPVLIRPSDGIPDELTARQYVSMESRGNRHEALEALVSAISSDPDWVRQHTRLLAQALHWERSGDDRGLLLRGSDLKAAQRSLAEQSAAREPQLTRLQTRFVIESSRGATRRLRMVVTGVAFALVVAVGLSVFALIQREQAVTQRDLARSRQMAAEAQAELPYDRPSARRLALDAFQLEPTAEANGALRQVMTAAPKVLRGARGPILGATFDPTGRLLAAAGNDGTIRLWDTQEGRPTLVLRGSSGSVDAAAFSPDGRQLAAALGDGSILTWTLDRERVTPSILGAHAGPVLAISFSPDGRSLVSLGADGIARVWRSGRQRSAFSSRRGGPRVAAFAPDGRVLAIGHEDGTVELWDVVQGRLVESFLAHQGGVVAMAFSGGVDQALATAGHDETVRIWDPLDGTTTLELRIGHRDPIAAASFSSQRDRLVTVGEKGTLRVWDLASRGGELTLARNAGVLAAAFSPDGHHLAGADLDGTVRIWPCGACGPLDEVVGLARHAIDPPARRG